MADVPAITAEYVRSRLHYDAETGIFRWRARPDTDHHSRRWNLKFGGTIAGNVYPAGYRQIKLNGQKIMAHRLAWLYVHGEWPAGHLDHRDRNRDHNALDNLRPATDTQNQANAGLKSTNKSGYKGVCWDKRDRYWRATIMKGRKQHHLGAFSTAEEAARAYAAAADRLFGDYANTD